MIKSKKWFIPMMAMFFLFMMIQAAEAHVTVRPTESLTNAYEKYTVRVPVEKDINTTKVTLQVPEGVNLVSVLPMTDWDYELKKDANEQVTSVIWTAKNGGIGPNEFIEFSFIGANPSKAGEVSWKALQTYEDDSVVEWIGAKDSEEPASVTTIIEGDAVAPHGDSESSSSNDVTKETADKHTSSKSSNWLPISLGVVAILLALISLFRKRA